MPIDTGKGSYLATRVGDIVRQAEIAMLRLVAMYLTLDADTSTREWAAIRYRDVAEIRRRAKRFASIASEQVRQAIEAAVTRAYIEGMAWAVRDLDAIDPHAYLPGGLDPKPYAELASAECIANAERALALIPTLLASAYSEAVAAGALHVLDGSTTRLRASQRVLDDLLGAGIRGYRDSAGRHWALDTYIEMAVRTTAGNAALDGHHGQLQAAGHDLVVVSDSPRECSTCRPWERQVLSLSGQTGVVVARDVDGQPVTVVVAGSLAQARRAGLMHPNCTHATSLYIPGVTKTGAAHHDPQGYEDKQRQREIERHIREWKRREALALTPEAQAKARRKVREWQAHARENVARTGTKRLGYREQVGTPRTPLAH